MGTTSGDVRKVARLVAVKTFLNEFVAYDGMCYDLDSDNTFFIPVDETICPHIIYSFNVALFSNHAKLLPEVLSVPISDLALLVLN